MVQTIKPQTSPSLITMGKSYSLSVTDAVDYAR
jgi:hypothetical protein